MFVMRARTLSNQVATCTQYLYSMQVTSDLHLAPENASQWIQVARCTRHLYNMQQKLYCITGVICIHLAPEGASQFSMPCGFKVHKYVVPDGRILSAFTCFASGKPFRLLVISLITMIVSTALFLIGKALFEVASNCHVHWCTHLCWSVIVYIQRTLPFRYLSI